MINNSTKFSGVDWIGDIPSHWDMTRVKNIAKWETGFTPDTKNSSFYDGNDPWVTIGDLKDKYIDTSENNINGTCFPESWKVKKGSLLFSFKLSIGQVAFNTVPLFTNEAICAFSPKSKVYLPYFYYAAPIFIVKNAKYNIYNAPLLNQDLISNALVLNIPLQDQTTIANYLDQHTAKIDREVELLERRIELTEEYRQALIYETVTKGLNPEVQMKASGVDWIGDIPAHWEVKRVKDLYTLKKGRNAFLYSNEYVLDSSNQGIYPVYSGQTENEGIMSFISTYEYKSNGTLLTTTVGAKAMSVKKIHGCFTLSQNCAFLASKCLDLNYSFYRVGLSFKFARSLIPSHMQPSLRKDDLGYMYTVDAPLQEQNEIAIYLDQETSKLDRKLELLRKKVVLLKEYKQSLIYEAVTGKIPTSEM